MSKVNKKFLIIFILFLVLAAAGIIGWIIQNNKPILIDETRKEAFISGPNMLFSRFGHTATLLPNGKILVVGGADLSIINNVLHLFGLGSTETAELFDPKTNKFSFAGFTKLSYIHHIALLTSNGNVIISGVNGIEEYNSKTKKFILIKKHRIIPSIETDMMLLKSIGILLNDGRVLSTQFTNSTALSFKQFAIFDPKHKNEDFITGNSQLQLVSGLELLPDNRVLILGGNLNVFNSKTNYKQEQLMIFDPEINKVVLGPSTISGICIACVKMKDNRILTINYDAYNNYSHLEIYDPKTNRFNIIYKKLPPEDSYSKLILLKDGRILILPSIVNKNYKISKVVKIFDIKARELKQIFNDNLPEEDYTQTALYDGRVIIIGGRSDHSSLKSTKIFIP